MESPKVVMEFEFGISVGTIIKQSLSHIMFSFSFGPIAVEPYLVLKVIEIRIRFNTYHGEVHKSESDSILIMGIYVGIKCMDVLNYKHFQLMVFYPHPLNCETFFS